MSSDDNKLPDPPPPMFAPEPPHIEPAPGGVPSKGPMRQSTVKHVAAGAKGAAKPQQPAVPAPQPEEAEQKAEGGFKREAFLVNIPGSELLSDAEIQDIIERSRIKAQKDLKERALKSVSDQYDKIEARRTDPNEELEMVQVDVPGFAAINKNGTGIMIDGVIYQHGLTYTLPRRQAQSLKDIMAQAWSHEDETGGASRDTYRRPRNSLISPRDVGTPTTNLMRV